MGETFQSIVDKDASVEEAEKLAHEILNWLVERGIVKNTLTDCVLGDQGYPPGPNYEQVTTDHHYDIRSLWTNGLHLIIGRTVFHAGGGIRDISCPQCHIVLDDESRWVAAISEWYEGKVGTLRCVRCEQANPITEWIFDPPWGFGNLGFEFWNWPALKDDFVSEIGARLKHRIIMVKGKL